jgi:hypothetical protein
MSFFYRSLKIIFVISVLSYGSLFGDVLKINYPSRENSVDSLYQIALLKFILNKANVPYELTPRNGFSGARTLAELKSGKNINLYWMGTSELMEKELIPVRYPLFRGLLGYRVFIINKNEQTKFEKVKNLQDLQKLKGAQGLGWSDIAILENSGLKQFATEYENIFKMLDSGGRIAYFSRGLSEAFSEVDARKKTLSNLKVEKNILLTYPLAMFFFVSPNDKPLADALNKGFELAYADGSFEKFFYNHPVIKESLKNAHLKKRIKIEITNPFLTNETIKIDKKYWHTIQ